MAVLTSTSSKRNAWIQWLDHCSGRNGSWSNPTFFGRTIGGVPTPAVGAYAALEQALKATGYTPRSRWAYNFRGISGKPCSCSSYGYCSLHGNGIAIDIDPNLNPYIATSTFSWAKTAFTPAQIAAVEGIKNTKGEQIWFWGGRWRSIKDYMHFELQVDPGSVVVNWATVPGNVTPPPDTGDEQVLKRGDKGPAVTKLQVGLMNEKSGSLPQYGADGDFGAETETAVKDYQTRAQLDVTGAADGVTMSLLMEYVADRVGGGGTTDTTARTAAAAAKTAADAAAATAKSALTLATQIRDKLKALY